MVKNRIGAPGSVSAATRVFLVVAALGLLFTVCIAVILVWSAQNTVRAEAGRLTAAISLSIAESPETVTALTLAPETASSTLQPWAVQVIRTSGVDFITVMTADGIRITHPDPQQIGHRYLGTIPSQPSVLTQEYTGTLGPSIRTIVPVRSSTGTVEGWVASGVTVESSSRTLLDRLPIVIAVAALAMLSAAGCAVYARQFTRRIAGRLTTAAARDAISSAESMRTMGEALRAQAHEHGNRVHTAVALIELGRSEEAAALLTENVQQTQELVDQVTHGERRSDAWAALLLGKSSQAAERGIRWEMAVGTSEHALPLSDMDAVSLIGNLVDNALDAAGAATGPRWVRVSVEDEGDDVVIDVSDSGEGVDADIRNRLFERGVSTKPAGAMGRGDGLALVHQIVTAHRGSITVRDAPTRFIVRLPKGARS